jgi:hypothetical protein
MSRDYIREDDALASLPNDLVGDVAEQRRWTRASPRVVPSNEHHARPASSETAQI